MYVCSSGPGANAGPGSSTQFIGGHYHAGRGSGSFFTPAGGGRLSRFVSGGELAGGDGGDPRHAKRRDKKRNDVMIGDDSSFSLGGGRFAPPPWVLGSVMVYGRASGAGGGTGISKLPRKCPRTWFWCPPLFAFPSGVCRNYGL